MSKRVLLLAAFVGGVLGAMSLESVAQEEDVVDLQKLTCRSYLKMDGDERDDTTIFLHGYISGKNSQTIIKIPEISAASDKVLESCIDKPDALLVGVFEASRN